MTDKSQQFASDNYSGICPEAWAAMEQANQGLQRHRRQLPGAVFAVPELP